MTCREVSGLLPLFFDGELDARQMRAVALHSSRCAACEDEVRQLERVQEAVALTIRARVEELDFSLVWPAVAARLRVHRPAWGERLRAYWDNLDLRSWLRVPALAAAAASAAIAITLWSGQPSEESQVAEAPPVVDNSAIIDSLDSSAEAVAVLSEPETNTTVLWINDDSDYGAEGFPP
ncbi:MAG: zf-HC2 domain-containing protein [Deltaproteobacteria bacterium]|nr:zf-HC2 domain-containing protein [Deltaproteobacteria bacterium]